MRTLQSSSIALLGHLFITALLGQVDGPPSFYFGSADSRATINKYFSVQLATIGGLGQKVYAIGGGTLPPGLTLSSDGLLFGVPTQLGEFTFVARATDSVRATVRTNVVINVVSTSFEFVQTSLTPAMLNVSYSAPLSLSGSVPPVSLRLDAGNLPPGLTLNATGISGTPTLAGTYLFTVAATHSALGVARRQFLLHVTSNPAGAASLLGLRTDPLPNGLLDVPYGASLIATEGTQPYRFQLQSGQLPPGLSLLANGAISGIPNRLGTYSFEVSIQDASGAQIYALFSIEVTASNLFDFSNQTLPSATSNTPYTATVGASGGSQPYRFSISFGTLPQGLSISLDGQITGTPTGSGSIEFTLRARDISERYIERTYTLNVVPAATSQPPPAFLTVDLPVAIVGLPYSTNILVSSLRPPITFQILNGVIPPPGLTFSSTGALTGTPTIPGFATFTVQATDAAGNSAQQTFRIEVRNPTDVDSILFLPLAVLNQPYSTQLSAEGNAGPYTFVQEAGQLPFTMDLTPSGRLFGQPRLSGAYDFVVRVTDARGTSVLRTYRLNVQLSLLTVTLNPLPEARVRVGYTANLSAAGGSPPYAYRLVGGVLPAGLSFDSANGRITGLTTLAGSYPLTIRIRDLSGLDGDASTTLTVRPVSLSLTVSQLPDARLNEAYSFSLSSSGGTSPYTYLLISGSLPPGLSLSNLGAITGTPTQAGGFTPTLRIVDATGVTLQTTLQLNVRPALPSFSTLSLPEGTLNVPYAAMVQARSPGGLALSYRLSVGALPAGLAIGVDGRISGTPSAAGTFVFTVQVTDTQGGTAQVELALRIVNAGGHLSVSSVAPPAGQLYFPYSFQLAAAGGFPPYSWSLASGSPPSGLRLDPATGNLTGVPLAFGFYTFKVKLTDSRGTSADTPAFTIPVFEAIRLRTGQVGQPYSADLSSSSGSTYALDPTSIGGLPPGVSLNSSGVLSGSPTAAGEYTFGLRVLTANGVASQTSVTLPVLPLNAAFPLTLNLPGASVGTMYRQLLRSSDQQIPGSISLASGSLPPGISLDPGSAVLSGIPSSTGDFFFTLTAQTNSQSASYRISVAPSGAPAVAAVTNAASYERNAIAPGQVLTIFGSRLGPAALRQFVLTNNFLPKELALTRVLFDGLAAPIFYTSDGQVSAIAPFDLLGRIQTNMTVEYNGMVSAPLVIPVTNSQPALFTADGSGKGQAAILNENGTVNGPGNPAPVGSVIVFYATGAGRLSPGGVDGRVAQTASSLFQASSVQIAGQTAELLYAGNAPGIVEGIIQVNARIPQGLTEGSKEIRLSIGGNLSPVGVSLWVR